jgi:hypothetical protein
MAVAERESGLLVSEAELWHPETPTGLDPEEVRELSDVDAQVLGLWHAEVAGDVASRPFWPAAIRRLSMADRLMLASDPALSAAWQERERRRVKHGLWEGEGADARLLMTAVEYFIRGYGHVQPEEGPPIPFDLWSAQAEALREMVEALRVIVLKARQLGLTWLALHQAFHMLAFDPATPVAKVMALSKKSEDAKKLLQRARRINELLPGYLRAEEDPETKGSLSKFGIADRGEMVSLTSNPDDARSETASFVIWDEAAFTRNGGAEKTLTALLATLGTRGRLCLISTGNGPAEAPGDGQTFARLWQQATSGDDEVGLVPIFLADSVHPNRSADWRRRERKKYLSEEDFLKEHPETEDDAFSVVGGLRVYSPAGINAAERLGGELDEQLLAGELVLPEQLFSGGDFGEYTHLLVLWPLEGGGWYVPPGEVAPETPQEVGESTRQFCESIEQVQEWACSNGHGPEEDIAPLMRSFRYDAAGIQSRRTFVKTVHSNEELLRLWDTTRKAGKPQIRVTPIPFAKYKDDTKDHLRSLFTRSAKSMATRLRDLAEDDDEYCDGTGVIAISPRNKVLLRQLRGLELKDDGTGRIEKGEDHGPDALIAGDAPEAVKAHAR